MRTAMGVEGRWVDRKLVSHVCNGMSDLVVLNWVKICVARGLGVAIGTMAGVDLL